LVSPIQNYTILAGFITGGVIRGLSVGVVVIISSAIFCNIYCSQYIINDDCNIFIINFIFYVWFFKWLVCNDWDDINVIPTFIMTPLTYLGGIFFSISMLPGIWQEIALINPILYLINALRFSMLGITDVSIMIAFL
jgi:ABC-2 type transport system permease protein